MKITFIDARDLPESWFLCVRRVLEQGREYVISKGSFEGVRRKEFDLVIVKIETPSLKPLSPSTPIGLPSVCTDSDCEKYLLYLMTDERQPGEDYTYGMDLAPQIEEVIRRYKQWGYDTNRLCMTVGSKDSLFLYRKEEETGQKASSQCLRLVDTRIDRSLFGTPRLHFISYWRSWDLLAGYPVNLGGLQLLKEYMASEIGVEDGELIAVSKGLHIYEHSWDLAKQIVYI